MWVRNGRWILPEMPNFHVAFRNLLHAVNLWHGTNGFTSPPKEGVLRNFSPWKIRQLRPGLNPRTWVPKASTLPLDHRSHLATGWTDQGSNPSEGKVFLCLSRLAPRFTTLLYNGYWVFPRGQVAGVWWWLPTPSSTDAAMGWSYNSASPLWLRRHFMEWPLPLSVSEPWPSTLWLITSLTELCHGWQTLSQSKITENFKMSPVIL